MSEYGLTVYFLWSPGRIDYFLASGSLVLRYCAPVHKCPVCLLVALGLCLCLCPREPKMHGDPPTLAHGAFAASPRFWGVRPTCLGSFACPWVFHLFEQASRNLSALVLLILGLPVLCLESERCVRFKNPSAPVPVRTCPGPSY